jgi:hypothetical protein
MRTLAMILVAGALALAVVGCGGHGPAGGSTGTMVELLSEDALDGASELGLPLQDTASATVLRQRPSDDTYINAGHTTKNYGGLRLFQCGNYPDGFSRRALLRFGMKSIPPDSTIKKATLRLWPVEVINDVVRCRVYFKTRSWDESTATWANSRSGYSTPPAAVTRVTPSMEKSWVDFDVTTLVQYWEFDRSRNYGCMIRGHEGSGYRAVLWAARDFANRARRPRLIVRYDTSS